MEFGELAVLSVEELKDIIDTGAPGMPIGKAEAARLAREYAGITNAELNYEEVDAELDDGIAHYEVDLYTSAGEFEYNVDAYTGAILQGEANILSDHKNHGGTTDSKSRIGEAKALDIAAENFYAKHPELRGTNILNNRVSLDRDDGKIHYDVEFFISGHEVDYEIDAYTGSVLSWDTDYEGPHTPADTDIGSDKAKAVALAHAGLTQSQVSWIRAEKDEDNGRLEYEVDFKAGGMEYEYTIDAATGAVLEHETDWDD